MVSRKSHNIRVREDTTEQWTVSNFYDGTNANKTIQAADNQNGPPNRNVIQTQNHQMVDKLKRTISWHGQSNKCHK